MPEIAISEAMYDRIVRFKQVVEAVIEEEIDFDSYVEFILGQGIDSILITLMGSADQATLLESFRQLSSQYPAQVYEYVAETLKRGTEVQELEELRRRIGFRSSPDTDDEVY